MQVVHHIREKNVVKYSIIMVFGSMFLAATAWIQVPLFPVPITMQTYGLLVIGGLYGYRLGIATVLLYLAEAMAGLPVLAGGSTGIVALMGPTGGFLLGFIGTVGLMGIAKDKGWTKHPLGLAVSLMGAHGAVFIPGVLWLALFVGFTEAMAMGVTPFLFGFGGSMFLIKTAMAYASIRGGKMVLEKIA